MLNSLITINNDRIAGYETASEETEEIDLKTMFAGQKSLQKADRDHIKALRDALVDW